MNYYSNHNLAYDFALFEEEPQRAPAVKARGSKAGEKTAAPDGKGKVNQSAGKSEAETDPPRRKKGILRLKRRKSNFGRIAAAIVFGLVAVVIIASIIHGQVQLTELNQEIIDARTGLSELQSRYTQLEMQVAAAISTDEVEKYAQENLHMSKATNSQKEFISLAEGDKAEVILEEDKNIFEQIADAIASLWS